MASTGSYEPMTCPNAMNTMKTKNVNLLKLWVIIQYHYAVDSQGDLKLTKGKKKTLISVFQEKIFLKIFLFNMWNYLEKHSMVKKNSFDRVCKNE